MPKYQYDLTIIGGGSGGLVAARLGAALGARTCLIDKTRLGGDCLYHGCVPSKSLIHAAKIVHNTRQLNLFVQDNQLPEPKIDMAKITTHIAGIIERIGAAESVYVENVAVKFGQATFRAAHELQLNDTAITSQAFIVATGSRPAIPAIDGLANTGYLTNESVFNLQALPESIIIIGGGPVGVELAQALARLGSAVTLVQKNDRVLAKEEPEVSELVAKILTQAGVKILTNTQPVKVGKVGDSKWVEVQQGQTEVNRIEAAEILIATGRTPNTEELGLAQAGVYYDYSGIKVNDHLQTTTDNILAIGDVVTDSYRFTHVAAYQGSLAAQNALLPVGQRKIDYRVVPWVTFTDPEVGRVGLTEAEARRQHGEIKVQRLPWHEIDRAQTTGETEGFIKLILDDKGKELYGAHLVGAGASEMLAEIALVMQHKLGISGILETIHAYPTLATGLQTTAFEAYLGSSSLATARKLLSPVLALRG